MKYLLYGTDTNRLLFKQADDRQFNAWLPFHASSETHIHWNEPRANPEIECKKWFARQKERYDNDLGGMNALFEKNSGKLIGYCGLLVQEVDSTFELEIGYSLLPSFWGNGYATEAAIHCRDQAFKRSWSESLISIIATTNIPSRNVALKNGMELDTTTSYKGNAVDIYRINEKKWHDIIS